MNTKHTLCDDRKESQKKEELRILWLENRKSIEDNKDSHAMFQV